MQSFTPRYRHHSLRLSLGRAGAYVITTTMQGQGAPVVDGAMVYDREGRTYRGRAVLLKPWKRGERSISARALVLARQVDS